MHSNLIYNKDKMKNFQVCVNKFHHWFYFLPAAYAYYCVNEAISYSFYALKWTRFIYAITLKLPCHDLRVKCKCVFTRARQGNFPAVLPASKGNFSLHAKFNLSNLLRCNSIVERALSLPSECIRFLSGIFTATCTEMHFMQMVRAH